MIALAMSWTSYVEKSGSGTGEIIDKCRDHGLATPIYDPTEGFFKTIIWRNGYGPAAKRDPVAGPSQMSQVKGHSRRAQSGAQVRGPSQGPESNHQGKRAQKRPRKGPRRCCVKALSRCQAKGPSREGTVEGHSQRAQSKGTVRARSRCGVCFCC